MRSFINAITAMNGMTGRQIRTGVQGMVQLREAGSVAPRFYCGPVWVRRKRSGSLRTSQPSCWSGAEHCPAARCGEVIREPRSCEKRPSHALPSVTAT
jgi:hypothetical protein